MELKEVIEKRRSIRNFTGETVPVPVLQELVKAASYAPSINNSQPWKFIAVTDSELLRKMSEAVHERIDNMFPAVDNKDIEIKKIVEGYSTFFENAPSLIVVLSEPYRAIIDNMLNNTDYSHKEINAIRNYPNIQTIGAAVEHILLRAVDLGYGGCWLSGLLVAKEELKQLLEIPEPYDIAACVAIGIPAEEPKPKIMKPFAEIFLTRP